MVQEFRLCFHCRGHGLIPGLGASDGLWGTLLCRKGSSVAADAPLRGRGSAVEQVMFVLNHPYPYTLYISNS